MLESEPRASFALRAGAHCQELGYTEVRVLKSDQNRAVYQAEREGRSVVLKLAEQGTPAADNFQNQAKAQEFLLKVMPTDQVAIPRGECVIGDGFVTLAMESLDGQVFAESLPDGLRRELTEADEDRLIAWLTQVRAIPMADMPTYFKDIAEQRLNDAFYASRLEANAAAPLERGLLSGEDLARLKTLWRESLGPNKTFQHHDVVPFNLMAMTDGRLGLLDGEYARLGMPGYDAAYYFIQTATLLNRPAEARRFLDKFLQTWDQAYPDDHMRQAIQAPLAYRIVANLQDAGMSDVGVRERTLALTREIVAGSV